MSGLELPAPLIQSMEPLISIVIPVYREGRCLPHLLAELRELPGEKELIVVDGEVHGGTIREIKDADVTCLSSAKGRATQFNRGAAAARGTTLLFLHADTRLPPSALGDVHEALQDDQLAGGCFDLELDDPSRTLKLYSRFINLRTRLSRIPVGDQAIFLRREVFEELGGYPELPLLEEIELMRLVKRKGLPIRVLRRRVVASARRFQQDGRLRRILTNWWIIVLYYLGVAPAALKRFYDEERDPGC